VKTGSAAEPSFPRVMIALCEFQTHPAIEQGLYDFGQEWNGVAAMGPTFPKAMTAYFLLAGSSRLFTRAKPRLADFTESLGCVERQAFVFQQPNSAETLSWRRSDPARAFYRPAPRFSIGCGNSLHKDLYAFLKGRLPSGVILANASADCTLTQATGCCEEPGIDGTASRAAGPISAKASIAIRLSSNSAAGEPLPTGSICERGKVCLSYEVDQGRHAIFGQPGQSCPGYHRLTGRRGYYRQASVRNGDASRASEPIAPKLYGDPPQVRVWIKPRR